MNAQTETQETEAQSDGPLLDLTDAGVKKFIKQAKARGYVTMEELNKVLPSEEVTPDAIEDTLAMLSEMGVNVVQDEEEAAESQSTEVAAAAETAVAETPAKAAYDRTDDPVRMYLREMGSVELLSREGEIAIAKRIEAGRDAMISGLCESALTFEAIMVWRDELENNRILLREVPPAAPTQIPSGAVPSQVRVLLELRIPIYVAPQKVVHRPEWQTRRVDVDTLEDGALARRGQEAVAFGGVARRDAIDIHACKVSLGRIRGEGAMA